MNKSRDTKAGFHEINTRVSEHQINVNWHDQRDGDMELSNGDDAPDGWYWWPTDPNGNPTMVFPFGPFDYSTTAYDNAVNHYRLQLLRGTT